MRPHPLLGDASLREVAVPAATLWRSPDSPRDVDTAAVQDRADPAGWADSMGRDVRLGLHGRTETQLLLGEPAVVLEQRDGWSRVAALWQQSSAHEQGYRGWVRTAHLGEQVPVRRGAAATVVTRTASCAVEGGEQVELSFGTTLWLDSSTDDAATLLLPGGGRGVVPLSALRLTHQQQPVYGADDVLSAARQFLGLRYLWGGTSTWGLDCSGLVHLTLRSFGMLVPRDAHDQAASPDVTPVPLEEVKPGDLYFFARPGERIYHVGFVTRRVAPDGTRWMLHAPEGGELIEDAPLTAHRVDTLVSAGRVHTTDAGQIPTCP